MKNSCENFPCVLADQKGVLEFEPLSKPYCEEKQCSEYRCGADCVQPDNQAKKIYSDARMNVHMHESKDLPFSKYYKAPDDFLKAEQKLDAKANIDEAWRQML